MSIPSVWVRTVCDIKYMHKIFIVMLIIFRICKVIVFLNSGGRKCMKGGGCGLKVVLVGLQ